MRNRITECLLQVALEESSGRQKVKIARAISKPGSSPADVVAEVAAAGYTGRLTQAAVKKHREGLCACASGVTETETMDDQVDASRQIELGADGGTLSTGTLKKPVVNNDFGFVFEAFGLNPSEFEIVGDTVRMSVWQQSARSKDGDRDVVNLYAYRASFRRVVSEDSVTVNMDQLRAMISAPPKGLAKKQSKKTEPGRTYVITIADPQLGKKGTVEAVANWRRGVQSHIAEIRRLVASGVKIDAIHVAFMGDETEGVCNSYRNQPHTVELNLSEQLELDAELRTWTINEVLKLGFPVSVSSVLSNHGETWVRNGGKDPITTQADNASTSICRQVKKAFDTFLPEAPLTWMIADSDPAVVAVLSGERVYFTHGHIQKGRGASTELRTKNAVEKQILSDPGAYADLRLYVTAHYHHEGLLTGENRYYVSCPALEAEQSSEYMLNQYGVWSKPGMLGFMVGGDLVGSVRPFAGWNVF